MSSDLKRSIHHTLLNEELPSWETIIQSHVNLDKDKELDPHNYALNIYINCGRIELFEAIEVNSKCLYQFPLTEDEILDVFYQRFPRHQFTAQTPEITDLDEFRWVWMLSNIINDYESDEHTTSESDNMYLLIIMNADTYENSILPISASSNDEALSRYRNEFKRFYEQANGEIYPHLFITLLNVSTEAEVNVTNTSSKRQIDINDPNSGVEIIHDS